MRDRTGYLASQDDVIRLYRCVDALRKVAAEVDRIATLINVSKQVAAPPRKQRRKR